MTSTTRPAVLLRELCGADEPRMGRLFFRLSPETIYRRFMTHYSDPQPLRPLLDVDGDRRLAVVAVDDTGEIIGVARYAKLADDSSAADIAVLVEDAAQRHGVGSALLAELTDKARAAGVRRFTGTMLAGNDACANLLRKAFPDVVLQTSHGETTLHVTL
ncbi:MAG: hypothetical protein QOG49_1281 [Frankiaceae bacterium]|nr:hypothetical protein [Frankiaceae bacterium]